MKKTVSVAQISHGMHITGGYLHEQFVFNSVCAVLENQGVEVKRHSFRTNRFFKGLSQFKMVWQGIVNAQSDLNFVSNWMALYAILGNLFSRRKIIITWHHHDDADAKTLLTRLYMKLLFTILSITPSKRIAILVVSDYWVTFFKSRVSSSVTILYFPNVFNTTYYQSLQQPKKSKQIYLGQYAFKTDNHIFELAGQLKQQGYYCFFTTLIDEQITKHENYDIVKFEHHEDYLKSVAQSEYTIAYVKINEGWNRVAHESILLGTQVIGVNKGGLGDLLKESNSIQVTSVKEFLEIVLQKQKTTIPVDFLLKYDVSNQSRYAMDVINFLAD